jgi:hypothetical protein
MPCPRSQPHPVSAPRRDQRFFADPTQVNSSYPPVNPRRHAQARHTFRYSTRDSAKHIGRISR